MDPITDKEAWNLFRVAAISEACSWLLLLTGILMQYLDTRYNRTVLAVGGSIHGIVFLAYFAILIWVWRILRLTLFQAAIAAFASVIPFGTLIFEQWLARQRSQEALGSYRQVTVRGVILNKKKVLALQPLDDPAWCLPGGSIIATESPEQALIRTITQQTGIPPVVGTLLRIQPYPARLELFFTVTNPSAYSNLRSEEQELEKIGVGAIGFLTSAELAERLPGISDLFSRVSPAPSRPIEPD